MAIKIRHLLVIVSFCLITTHALGQTKTIEPKATIFITYVQVEGKNNMDPSNCIQSIIDQLKDKTSLVLVDKAEGSDLTGEYSLTKGLADNRHGKLVIKETKSGAVIFESKQVRGTANAISGFNGTRDAAKRIVEKQLLKKFPKIAW